MVSTDDQWEERNTNQIPDRTFPRLGMKMNLTSCRGSFHHQSVGKRDPRVDAYIEKAAPFAKPILKHLRRIVHIGCPDAAEAIKWQFPHFDYKGILCGMAAFKSHCSFGFWKSGSHLREPKEARTSHGPIRTNHVTERFTTGKNFDRLCAESGQAEWGRSQTTSGSANQE